VKRILILISLLFLVGCSSGGAPESAPAAAVDQAAELAQKDARITELELEVQDLTDSLASLQAQYDALQAAPQPASGGGSQYLCPEQLTNMKYQNAMSAIAILEGWFAVQPQVAELQGSYSTQFWNDVKSRIHTIRYISADTNLSTTNTFLIFFEEAGWKPGLLDMTNQCWLDFPD
jgi:hypothetical protein